MVAPTCSTNQNARQSLKMGKQLVLHQNEKLQNAKKVVCDPSYLPDKVKAVRKVARAICIMSHPIPHTNDAHSTQVILPQKQLGRKSDMYSISLQED
ncbi:unnamed protein product [Lactuca virosa]|uniref:Guanosine nucleotide diphosphate dissociation inhibitor n=1 Tax=Lactuca virosa TaxID=75947 RepID=A0AAU9NA95_9ASTR|nr:unnamed protein product [Lactuca virosa]